MPTVRLSRTLNPLHFEDLEPRRFEDLVRQLVYDFRHWRALEATGRSGSDEGFDARGFEVDPNRDEDVVTAGDDNETPNDREPPPIASGRRWLIQCKRETAIGPAKLLRYLDDIPGAERSELHGLILAAAANFSKKARDDFRLWCSHNGLSECFIWGRGELEDMLFQPKNDHLLFAYFGFSLSIRRRGQISSLKASLAMKRKLRRLLSARGGYFPVLLRDIEDKDYPTLLVDDERKSWWQRTNRWRVVTALELTHQGFEVQLRRFFAYFDESSGEWDAADILDVARNEIDDPWEGQRDAELEDEIRRFWNDLPEDKRTMIEVNAVVRPLWWT